MRVTGHYGNNRALITSLQQDISSLVLLWASIWRWDSCRGVLQQETIFSYCKIQILMNYRFRFSLTLKSVAADVEPETHVQQFTLIIQSYYSIYQDGSDNNCFVFHSCRVVCEDIRFGDGHFVNFVPVSNLSGGNKQRSMKCIINPECCFK